MMYYVLILTHINIDNYIDITASFRIRIIAVFKILVGRSQAERFSMIIKHYERSFVSKKYPNTELACFF